MCNFPLDYINHNQHSLKIVNKIFFVKQIKDQTLEYNISFRKHHMYIKKLILDKLKGKVNRYPNRKRVK